MTEALPISLLYVKNGKGGAWWPAAKSKNQIHAGWHLLPSKLIRNFDRDTIEDEYHHYYTSAKFKTQDYNALVRLLDRPSQHIWITFEDGYLWWCTVRDNAEASDKIEDSRGHFWLRCARPWTNRSLKGNLLAISDLPGPVTKVAGFRGTVGRPEKWQDILRIIRDETDPKSQNARHARATYERSIKEVIADLGHKDFELLIDMILIRSGWERISTLGKTQEGIDLDVENPAINERAFVQVKSEAGQRELNDYVKRFNKRRSTYGRMIFAVHSPKGKLMHPTDKAIRIWDRDETARLVVRLGLGERVEKMRG